MRQCEHVPEDHIVLNGILIPLHSIRNPSLLVPTLQGIPSGSVKLVVLVLRHPDVLLGEQSAVTLDAVWSGKEFLRGRSVNLVTDRFAADRVLLIEVLDLERPAVDRVVVKTLGSGDGSLADLVSVSLRVGLCINLHRKALLVHDRVLVSINGWVDS